MKKPLKSVTEMMNEAGKAKKKRLKEGFNASGFAKNAGKYLAGGWKDEYLDDPANYPEEDKVNRNVNDPLVYVNIPWDDITVDGADKIIKIAQKYPAYVHSQVDSRNKRVDILFSHEIYFENLSEEAEDFISLNNMSKGLEPAEDWLYDQGFERNKRYGAKIDQPKKREVSTAWEKDGLLVLIFHGQMKEDGGKYVNDPYFEVSIKPAGKSSKYYHDHEVMTSKSSVGDLINTLKKHVPLAFDGLNESVSKLFKEGRPSKKPSKIDDVFDTNISGVFDSLLNDEIDAYGAIRNLEAIYDDEPDAELEAWLDYFIDVLKKDDVDEAINAWIDLFGLDPKDILEAVGGAVAGKLELHNTDVNTAYDYAKKKFEEYGRNIDEEIPNFKANFELAKKKVQIGKTARKDMPVIDGTQVREFQARLKNGELDINKPFTDKNASNPFPQGLSDEEADRWLEAGLKDGSMPDDVIRVSPLNAQASDLKPIQKQIYFDKSADQLAQYGVADSREFLRNSNTVASDDDYIIDGHHRWLSALLLDPTMPIKGVSIDLPISKLLPLSVSYGDAIGNMRNESTMKNEGFGDDIVLTMIFGDYFGKEVQWIDNKSGKTYTSKLIGATNTENGALEFKIHDKDIDELGYGYKELGVHDFDKITINGKTAKEIKDAYHKQFNEGSQGYYVQDFVSGVDHDDFWQQNKLANGIASVIFGWFDPYDDEARGYLSVTDEWSDLVEQAQDGLNDMLYDTFTELRILDDIDYNTLTDKIYDVFTDYAKEAERWDRSDPELFTKSSADYLVPRLSFLNSDSIYEASLPNEPIRDDIKKAWKLIKQLADEGYDLYEYKFESQDTIWWSVVAVAYKGDPERNGKVIYMEEDEEGTNIYHYGDAEGTGGGDEEIEGIDEYIPTSVDELAWLFESYVAESDEWSYEKLLNFDSQNASVSDTMKFMKGAEEFVLNDANSIDKRAKVIDNYYIMAIGDPNTIANKKTKVEEFIAGLQELDEDANKEHVRINEVTLLRRALRGLNKTSGDILDFGTALGLFDSDLGIPQEFASTTDKKAKVAYIDDPEEEFEITVPSGTEFEVIDGFGDNQTQPDKNYICYKITSGEYIDHVICGGKEFYQDVTGQVANESRRLSPYIRRKVIRSGMVNEVFATTEIATRAWLEEMGVKSYVINPDLTVDVNGNVNLYSKGLTSIPVKFGKVTGGFFCHGNNLTSLSGCPEEVGGTFNCNDNMLVSLNGAPKVVGSSFYCRANRLTTLEGSPGTVGYEYDCSSNVLVSLKGAPTVIHDVFNCSNNNLTSLEGAPTKVKMGFICSINSLKSLRGLTKKGTKEVMECYVNCSSNPLTTLEGAPVEISKTFNCSYCNLESLEYAPKVVGEDFLCNNNRLITLEGAPSRVNGIFDCSHNNLTFPKAFSVSVEVSCSQFRYSAGNTVTADHGNVKAKVYENRHMIGEGFSWDMVKGKVTGDYAKDKASKLIADLENKYGIGANYVSTESDGSVILELIPYDNFDGDRDDFIDFLSDYEAFDSVITESSKAKLAEEFKMEDFGSYFEQQING